MEPHSPPGTCCDLAVTTRTINLHGAKIAVSLTVAFVYFIGFRLVYSLGSYLKFSQIRTYHNSTHCSLYFSVFFLSAIVMKETGFHMTNEFLSAFIQADVTSQYHDVGNMEPCGTDGFIYHELS
jgi:hypothetical protein